MSIYTTPKIFLTINNSKSYISPKIFLTIDESLASETAFVDFFSVRGNCANQLSILFSINARIVLAFNTLFRLSSSVTNAIFSLFLVSGASANSYETRLRIFSCINHYFIQRFTLYSRLQQPFNQFFLLSCILANSLKIPLLVESVIQYKLVSLISIHARNVANLVYRNLSRRFKTFGIADSKNIKNILSVLGDNVLGKNDLFSINGYNIFKSISLLKNIAVTSIKSQKYFSSIGNTFNNKFYRFINAGNFCVNHFRDFFVYSTVLNAITKIFLSTLFLF